MDECDGRTLRSLVRPVDTPHGRDESLRVSTYSTGQAKEGASADSAEERNDTTGVNPWRLHETQRVLRCIWITRSKLN